MAWHEVERTEKDRLNECFIENEGRPGQETVR